MGAESLEQVRVRSIAPVMEELTGPVTLALLGAALVAVRPLTVGPVDNTQILGRWMVAIGVIGTVWLIVRSLRRNAPGLGHWRTKASPTGVDRRLGQPESIAPLLGTPNRRWESTLHTGASGEAA